MEKLKTALIRENGRGRGLLNGTRLDEACQHGEQICPRAYPELSFGTAVQRSEVDRGNQHSYTPARKTAQTQTRQKLVYCADEPALILNTQNGCVDSFNQIVLAYQDCIFGTAFNILCDSELAADATQEAFIAAFRNIKKYHGGSFKAWLIRIVTNDCYDELRRQKRRPTCALEPLNDDEEEMDTPRWLADASMSPEKKLEMAELEHGILHCLNALPVDFRTVVILVDLQGLDYTQAASVIRVPLGTIKSRLGRGRMHLRKLLRNYFPGDLHFPDGCQQIIH